MEEVYGGVSFNRQGLPVPAIMGRLCIWRTMRSPQTYATYQENNKKHYLRKKEERGSRDGVHFLSNI